MIEENKIFKKLIFGYNILKNPILIVTVIISLGSVFSYLITYSFLFGYYFGGDIEKSFSNFELFNTVVPFDVKTMTFIFLLLSLSSSLIYSLVEILKMKNWTIKVVTLFSFVIFHIMLSAFFNSKVTPVTTLYFGAIWIFPLYILIYINYLKCGTSSLLKTMSGSFYGLIIFISLSFFSSFDLAQEWSLITFTLLIFVLGIIISKVKLTKKTILFFIFPYIQLLLFVIYSFNWFPINILDLSHFSQGLILIVISFISSLVISKIIEKKFDLIKENNYIKDESSILSIIVPIITERKSFKNGMVFLLIFLFGTYILLPRVALTTGKLIRSFTVEAESQFKLIEYETTAGELKFLRGELITHKDDVIYISDVNRNLVQIKTKYFYSQIEDK